MVKDEKDPADDQVSQESVKRVNQELYKRNAELAVRNKTLALLRKLDEISLEITSMENMSQRIVEAIAGGLGYDLVTLAVVESEKSQVKWLAAASANSEIAQRLDGHAISSIQVSLKSSLLAIEAVETERSKTIKGITNVLPEEITHTIEEGKSEKLQLHTMLVPLKFGRSVIGLLTLSTTRPWANISWYEYESIAGLIGLVSLALYKAKIYLDLQVTSGELGKANKQLKELDKAKSEFLSIASHQLYTPLTALRGYISMMLEGDFGKMPDEQKHVLDILDKSADHLIDLIKGLLDVSRIEAGRLELNLESVDLTELVAQLVQDLLPNAIAKNLVMEFHRAKDPIPHVVADQGRIRQVMLNFIDNAIKYTTEGRIDIFVEKKDDSIVFSVRDTGKGISEQDLAILFTKFTRVGGASRYHTQGTGLGLYVAKQIVREHRGTVKVESPGEGKGSVFSVALPVEGSEKSLKVGQKAIVEIKAAEPGQKEIPPSKLL